MCGTNVAFRFVQSSDNSNFKSYKKRLKTVKLWMLIKDMSLIMLVSGLMLYVVIQIATVLF